MSFEKPKIENLSNQEQKSEKEIKLEHIRREIEQVTDNLGKPIESGIKETVIMFRVNELPTSDSCEGHIDEDDLRPPYIEARMPDEPERWEGVDAAIEKIQPLKENDNEKFHEEYKKIMQNFSKKPETFAYQKWENANKALTKKTRDLLNEFYEERQVESDVKLRIEEQTEGNPRIYSGGEYYKSVIEESTKRINEADKKILSGKLEKYRAEMQAFTEFLENKYFSPESNEGMSDFKNEDIIRQILESGNKEKLKELAVFHKWTPEQTKLFRDFARLRRQTIEKINIEADRREKENPVADKEELNLGAYKEEIEPQVKEAILNMRRKGYSTYESGFYWRNNQIISFEKDYLKKFQLPQELLKNLGAEGIEVKIKPNSILLTLNKYLELDQIKKAWDRIEQRLPDLGAPAKSCDIPAAKSFREKQRE